MFLVNSRHRLFAATLSGSRSKSLHPNRAHLLPRLRCQFAEFLDQGSPERLGTFIPAYLCRFAVRSPERLPRGFSWQCRLTHFVARRPRTRLSALQMGGRICLSSPPTTLNQDIQHLAGLPSCVPPSVITPLWWGRNINLLSITYAFRPWLRDRLTLGRRALPRKP